MTDNALNTRIISKHADSKDWVASGLLLKEGELVLAKAELDGQSVYFIKAGLEQKSFVDSAWVYAKAADVYKWAKQAALPVKCADDITAEGYVEGNVISSITFTNNEIQYTTAQVPTKNQVEIIEEILQISIPEDSTEPVSVIITNLDSRIAIIEKALGNYISIKDRVIFENIGFTKDEISEVLNTQLNLKLAAQENHQYRFEIINKDNNLSVKFEGIATASSFGLTIDFVTGTFDSLYIADTVISNARSNYFSSRGAYRLNLVSNEMPSNLYRDLMPDNIKNTDDITIQNNYIKNNYIFNLYECGQLALDIEAGAQVNKIESITINGSTTPLTITDKNVNITLPSVGNGQFTVSGTGALTGTGSMTANQADNSAATLDVKAKGITTEKIADHAVSVTQIKAEQSYTGTDAEIWVFDGGGAE